MSRPKGSKNKSDEVITEYGKDEIEQDMQPDTQTIEPEPEEDKWISQFEAAEHFRTSESTIKMWIDHGHLEERNGRIPMRSITMCKFNSRRVV
ncbi:MAG TPA: hypothetical protein VJ327_10825 [Patescibacteria group bacterium]|nr:hypothetical protein [Patescibacteria group bacterium]